MIPRLLAPCLALAAAAAAQSPLNTIPTPVPNQWFLWTGCSDPNVYFNLTVNTTVTIQGLDVSLDNEAGAEGTVELYVTNPGTTTHVGNENNASVWTLRGSAPVVATGQVTTARVPFASGIVLTPGTYGVAVRYIGVRAEFLAGAQTFSTTELSLTTGSTQALSFTSQVFQPYSWLGRIHYLVGNTLAAGAINDDYGRGCNLVNGSFYQRFSCSGPASAALGGRSLSLVSTGGGYVLLPGTVSFVAPTAAAVSLPASDDGEAPVVLTNPFPYPGGVATQLFVHSNGIVSVGSNQNLTPNTFTPFVPGLLAAGQTAWFSWHDYNPTEPGSGTIKFEEVGPMVFITWDNVESYPDTQGNPPVPLANPSTFQFQFDTSTGQVNYVWQSITAIGTSVFGDEHVIGFSPGGPSPDAGPIDVATLTAATLTVPEVLPLSLTADPLPLLGNTVTYTTANETGQNLGIFFLATAQLPGVPLDVLGLPGCAAHVDIATGVGNLISNLGLPGVSMSVQLPIPNVAGLLGFEVFGQSVWLDPAANAFGALVSNGVRTRIGNF